MENNNNNHQYSFFWQFSDQLRIDTNNFSNLSINNDNNYIWSNSYASSKRPEDRRNFDFRIPKKVIPSNTAFNSPSSDRSSRFNDEFKIRLVQNMAGVGLNGGFNKGVYSNPSMNFNFNNNSSMDNFPISSKNYRNGDCKVEVDHFKNNSNNQYGGKNGKKNKNVKKENNNSNGEKNSVDLLRYSDNQSRFQKYPGFLLESISDGLPADHPCSVDRFMELFDSLRSVTKQLFIESSNGVTRYDLYGTKQ